MPDNFRSTYDNPSFAILLGCEVGTPSPAGFVTTFVKRGFRALIISKFDVHPAVAGAYLGCFARSLAKAAGSKTSLAAVHFDAINNCSWDAASAPRVSSDALAGPLTIEAYRDNALKYARMGNSQLRVCPVPLHN